MIYYIKTKEFDVKMTKKDLQELSQRALKLMTKLEANKALYQELDEITVTIAKVGETGTPELILVDNFAEKNVAFRPAAVRRFELKRVA